MHQQSDFREEYNRNKSISFRENNKKTEDQLKRLNEQKRRAFLFNKSERDNQIEKDNLNLLVKLEEIKKKGTNLKKRNTKSIHEAFVNPDRIKEEHLKYSESSRANAAKQLDNKNVKLAYHLTKAPASIDLRKQFTDFEKH